MEKERSTIIGEALSLFDDSSSGTRGTVFVLGKDSTKLYGSFKILCPFLGDLIDSLPESSSTDPVIIIPDCTFTSFTHLMNVLTKGYTEDCLDVDAVVEVAKALNIDLKNLFTDKPQVLKDEELEEGEIIDCDQTLAKKPNTETCGTDIKIADFSKLFQSVPNVMDMNDNMSSFSCQECDKTFSTKTSFEQHMKMADKHRQRKRNLKKEYVKKIPPGKEGKLSRKQVRDLRKKIRLEEAGMIASTLEMSTRSHSLEPRSTLPWTIESCAEVFPTNSTSSPAGLAVSRNGDIFVLDSMNSWIQVFSPDHRPLFSIYLGPGKVTLDKIAVCPYSQFIVILETLPQAQMKIFSQSGPSAGKLMKVIVNDQLQNPRAVTVDIQNRILVVDARVLAIFVFNHSGDLLNRISCHGLKYPSSVESVGEEILVSDYHDHCVKVYDHQGTLMRRLGGQGICSRPFRVIMTSSGQVLVADRQDKLLKLTVFSLDGQLLGTIKTNMNQLEVKDVARVVDGSLVVSWRDALYSLKFAV